MSDWQIGDLAVCVDGRNQPVPLLAEGRIYTVCGLDFEAGYGHLDNAWVELGLLFEEVSPPAPLTAFDPRRFRKIRPDAHEDCEPEFITLLKRSKRKVRA